ncbi:hypothetical protein TorRG33x02_056310 [Trema orientale]|uniref:SPOROCYTELESS-like EAR-containing protein n=1 Tax=Trema orientale TaxID=63057 RepID=A0A2P5FKS9_TREOI|nr:hypothetical protein TorRG33x02_056310 [Trema orientale]
MAQEYHYAQMCGSGGSGSGSGGKKPTKEKKAPQRGLGVAQLEKIRLEEQQKKASSAAAATMLSSTSFSNLDHSKPSSLTIPFHSMPPPPNPMFRPPLPAHNVDVRRPMSSVHQLANMAHINDGFEVPRHFNVPKHWNSCEHNSILERGESISPMLDPGLALHLNLPNESNNPIWPLTGLVQRTPQYQHPPPPSMVNVPTSTSLSPVLSFQIEPPSNQSYYGNYAILWPEEEKMVSIGKKRPYPFVDNHPPGPSFNFRIPTFSVPTIGDGSASSGDGGALCQEYSDSKFRDECPASCSTSIPELNIKENNSAFNANFLTLALPTTATRTSPGSKFTLPSSCLPFHNYDYHHFDTIPVQGTVEEPIFQHGVSGSTEQLPLYDFINCEAAEKEKSNCTSDGTDESIDLNLKL